MRIYERNFAIGPGTVRALCPRPGTRPRGLYPGVLCCQGTLLESPIPGVGRGPWGGERGPVRPGSGPGFLPMGAQPAIPSPPWRRGLPRRRFGHGPRVSLLVFCDILQSAHKHNRPLAISHIVRRALPTMSWGAPSRPALSSVPKAGLSDLRDSSPDTLLSRSPD